MKNNIFSKKNNEIRIDTKEVKETLKDASNKLFTLAQETRKKYDTLNYRDKKKVILKVIGIAAVAGTLFGLKKILNRWKR